MNPIENILKEFSPIILDGALATELENRCCNINDSLWSAKILAYETLPSLLNIKAIDKWAR